MNFKNTMEGPEMDSFGSRQVQVTSVVNAVKAFGLHKI
jgi:hypothetical protein